MAKRFDSEGKYLGGIGLNIRKWLGLFFKTLALGGIVNLLGSFFINHSEYAQALAPLDILDLSGLLVWYILYGFLFSIISQAGFFAYLFVNQFGLGIFRSFWPMVQIALIAFAAFDLVYFPYIGMDGEMSVWLLILIVLAIVVYGVIVAAVKVKETHPRAFIPTLFLMVVMSAIEWVPGLRTGDVTYAAAMIITLLACNTYQILMLHRLNEGVKGNRNIHGEQLAKKSVKVSKTPTK